MYRDVSPNIGVERMFTGTPPAITPAIEALCAEIAPGSKPAYVAHQPVQGATLQNCFPNVRNQVAAHGGALLYGWAIWEWRDIFLEAEHHSVWRKPDGTMVDITPHGYPTDGVLFLPDPAATFNFDTYERRINIKRAISGSPAVADWLEAVDVYQHALEACSVGNEYHLSPRQRAHVGRLNYVQVAGFMRILLERANALGRNDRCICRSGRKFKQCCMAYFS